MIFTSPIPDVTIPEVPLTPFVLARAADAAATSPRSSTAPTGRTMSYAQLDDAVRRLAGGLLAAGLAKGEVLAIMAPNSPEYGVVFHAVAMAGGVVTTINPTYTAGEVHHQLVDAGATRLVTIPMFLETATEAMQDTAVKELFVIGEAEGRGVARRRSSATRWPSRCPSTSTTSWCCPTRRARPGCRRA